MAWFVLTLVTLGCIYLFASVGVSIYRQRRGALKGELVGVPLSEEDLRGCWDELSDVTEGLQKHLEKFHFLLGGYDPDEAQRWSNEGAVWRGQWAAFGKRCRLKVATAPGRQKELEEILAVHEELSNTERDYTKELLRFGKDQAPRLDRVRERVKQIGERLAKRAAPTGETTP